mmetsp:Transcript_110980/g.345889  ORF Transcript_110980/g.345889 Transcript_110980/m.345889 type:complete len:217 (+) Transcript_110980:370-1020(+)
MEPYNFGPLAHFPQLVKYTDSPRCGTNLGRSLSGKNTQSGSTLTTKLNLHIRLLSMSTFQTKMKSCVFKKESVFCPPTPYFPVCPAKATSTFHVYMSPQSAFPSSTFALLITADSSQAKMLQRFISCVLTKRSSSVPICMTEKQKSVGKPGCTGKTAEAAGAAARATAPPACANSLSLPACRCNHPLPTARSSNAKARPVASSGTAKAWGCHRTPA